MWQLTNKRTGKLLVSNKDIELKTDSGKIISPQNIAYTRNSFYVDCKERPSGTK
jgi:hypothetical protein